MSDTKLPYGLGRRKTSVAQAQLLKGEDKRTINGRDFKEYFETVDMRAAVEGPLDITSQKDEFGFQIKIHGGGKRSQAGAARMALSRALLEVDSGFRTQLKEAGMLSRDARMKERKKPGLKGARRAPQFSKR